MASGSLSRASTGSTDPTASEHFTAVEKVIATMHERLEEGFRLEEMAEVAIMSRFHFNRVFRQVTGAPPGRFFGALRIDEAKKLLIQSDEPVTDVCFSLGYSSLGSFTKRFKAMVGISPGAFRGLNDDSVRESLPGIIEQASGRLRNSARGSGVLTGRADLPVGFEGTVFIGLFPSAIPFGRPVGCALLDGPGTFQIRSSDGDYFVRASAFPRLENLDALFLNRGILLGEGDEHIRIRNGRPSVEPRLTLRPPSLIDPPVLVTFPLLLRAWSIESGFHESVQ